MIGGNNDILFQMDHIKHRTDQIQNEKENSGNEYQNYLICNNIILYIRFFGKMLISQIHQFGNKILHKTASDICSISIKFIRCRKSTYIKLNLQEIQFHWRISDCLCPSGFSAVRICSNVCRQAFFYEIRF